MNSTSQSLSVQKQFGFRWMIAALLILLAVGSSHAQYRRSATAQLRISVIVVPILQAQQSVQAMQRNAEGTAAVSYHLQPIVLKQTREMRDKSTTDRLVGKGSAVLETVTSVLE